MGVDEKKKLNLKPFYSSELSWINYSKMQCSSGRHWREWRRGLKAAPNLLFTCFLSTLSRRPWCDESLSHQWAMSSSLCIVGRWFDSDSSGLQRECLRVFMYMYVKYMYHMWDYSKCTILSWAIIPLHTCIFTCMYSTCAGWWRNTLCSCMKKNNHLYDIMGNIRGLLSATSLNVFYFSEEMPEW